MTKGAFCAFSVSIESQMNSFALRASALSVKTKACIERQVWHHGAQSSAKIGIFFRFASERARS